MKRNDPRVAKFYTEYRLNQLGITKNSQCAIGGYYKLNLMRFSHTTPDNKHGKFAVIGAQSIKYYPKSAATNDSLYLFSPKHHNLKVPYVLHKGRVWFFVSPRKGTSYLDEKNYSINMSELDN